MYMMSLNPGNVFIERLALETKVNALQSHNKLLGTLQHELDRNADIVVSCGLLIFAMDVRLLNQFGKRKIILTIIALRAWHEQMDSAHPWHDASVFVARRY